MKKLIMAAVALTVIACGKKDETKLTEVTGASLQGTWKSACLADGANFRQATLTFSGNQLKGEVNIASDKDCTKVTAKDKVEATFTLGNTISGLPGAKEINVTLSTGRKQFGAVKIENDHLYLSEDEPGRDGSAPEKRSLKFSDKLYKQK